MEDKSLRKIILIFFIALFSITKKANTAFADTIGVENIEQQIRETITNNGYMMVFLYFGLMLVLLLTLFVKQLQRSHVKRYSKKYNKLLELNERYNFFEDIPASYSLTHMMKSKQALERANADEIFLYNIQ